MPSRGRGRVRIGEVSEEREAEGLGASSESSQAALPLCKHWFPFLLCLAGDLPECHRDLSRALAPPPNSASPPAPAPSPISVLPVSMLLEEILWSIAGLMLARSRFQREDW